MNLNDIDFVDVKISPLVLSTDYRVQTTMTRLDLLFLMYKDMTLSECKIVDPFIKKCKELKSLEPSLT